MMDEFKQLLMKKKQSQGDKPIDEHRMKAKADMAKSLSDMLGSDITEDMKKSSGVKKITIASDSTEGLKDGLDKAEDIVDPDEEYSEEAEAMHESMMAKDSEDSEDSDSPEEIQDKISELEKQLEELKSSKRA
jgi:CII-binding regulator of phage lambda lysogenization HflD